MSCPKPVQLLTPSSFHLGGGGGVCLFILACDLYRSWRRTFYPIFPSAVRAVGTLQAPLRLPPRPVTRKSRCGQRKFTKETTKERTKNKRSPSPGPRMPLPPRGGVCRTYVYPLRTYSIWRIPFLEKLFCQISHIVYRPMKPSSLQDITTPYQYFLLFFERTP